MKILRILMITALPFTASACGMFSSNTNSDDAKVESGPEDVVFDTREGPNTKRLIKDLPGGLVGDQANARHSGETLQGDDSTGDNQSGGNESGGNE